MTTNNFAMSADQAKNVSRILRSMRNICEVLDLHALTSLIPSSASANSLKGNGLKEFVDALIFGFDRFPSDITKFVVVSLPASSVDIAIAVVVMAITKKADTASLTFVAKFRPLLDELHAIVKTSTVVTPDDLTASKAKKPAKKK